MRHIEGLHDPVDIGLWFRVSRGQRIAHHFISHMDYPVVVFQDPVTEPFSDTDIVNTQDVLRKELDEPYVYDGVIHPEVALQKALTMCRENRSALGRL
jgi:hypothetical protein